MNTFDLSKFLQSGTIISSKKGIVAVGVGERLWQQHDEGISNAIFYFPDYFLESNKPWFTQEATFEIEIQTLIDQLESQSKNNIVAPHWKGDQKEIFSEAFTDLQNHFKNQTLKKAVPFVFEKSGSSMNQERLTYSLLSLLKNVQNNPLFIYGFWGGDAGMLGATPEILFNVKKTSKNYTLETVACAGTCPVSEVDALASDPKQLEEHRLVVEGIQGSISPFGKVNIGQLQTLKLPMLCHLMTPINAQLEGAPKIEKLIHALHPTPALGAFPKIEGMHWLRDYQTKIDRKRFGAPAGFMTKEGIGTFYVAIRNVQWDQNCMQIGAGCGIVSESLFEKEWEEINLKIQSTKNLLAL